MREERILCVCVEYKGKQVCYDGKARKSMWYKWKPDFASAEKLAWDHILKFVSRGLVGQIDECVG